MESYPTDNLSLPEYKEGLETWFLARLANELEAEPAVEDLPEGVILWAPNEGPQYAAYHSLADELYYGGGAGGGKTDLDCGLAITAHRKSMILRREKEMLKGIEVRLQEIIGKFGDYNRTDKMWRGLPGGRTIELGGCQFEHNKESYQGQPHDLIVFDEAPQFLESQVNFIIIWNRTDIPGQRVRVVFTGNPPTTIDGEWIIRRFGPWLDPDYRGIRAEPGELRWFITFSDGREIEIDGPGYPKDINDRPEPQWDPEGGKVVDGKPEGEWVKPISRTFIPARVEDNPFYMATGYKTRLMNTPEPLRSMLMKGIFNIGRDDDEFQLCPTEWVRLAQKRTIELHDSIRPPDYPLSALGVDVARGGAASTVIATRHWEWFEVPVIAPGAETRRGRAVAELLKPLVREGCSINFDVIAVGSAVHDALERDEDEDDDSTTEVIRYLEQLGIRVNPVNTSTPCPGEMDETGTIKFANLRACLGWRFREALNPETGQDICLPWGRHVIQDLCAPRFEIQMNGIALEPKRKTMERLGRPIDVYDAIILASIVHDLSQSTAAAAGKNDAYRDPHSPHG
jgi:hypothetical protein